VNNRKQYWKPRIEAKLQEQAQAQQPTNATNAAPLVKPRSTTQAALKVPIMTRKISVGDISSSLHTQAEENPDEGESHNNHQAKTLCSSNVNTIQSSTSELFNAVNKAMARTEFPSYVGEDNFCCLTN
jgi:hypothetical protein